MKHGALSYFETVGEDINGTKGMLSFKTLAKLKPNETVIFAWIVYKSKAHRNSVNKKVMKDPWIVNFDHTKAMPFDHRRMAQGGFKTNVEA